MSSRTVEEEIASLRRIAAFHGENKPIIEQATKNDVGFGVRYLFYFELSGASYISENFLVAKSLKGTAEGISFMFKKDFVAAGLASCLKVVDENCEYEHWKDRSWKTYTWKCEGHGLACLHPLATISDDHRHNIIHSNGNWYEN